MNDPFPRRELLGKAEVRELLGFGRTAFDQWLKSDDARGFPKPVRIGETPKGRPVLKWKKSLVMAFIDLLGA